KGERHLSAVVLNVGRILDEQRNAFAFHENFVLQPRVPNGSQLPNIDPNVPSSRQRDNASNSLFDFQRPTSLWMPTSELFSTFLRSYRELIPPKELLITVRVLLNQMPA